MIPRGYSFSVEEAGMKVLLELSSLPRIKSSLIVLPFLTTFAVDLVPGNFLPTICGKSPANLTSSPANSIITSPVFKPPLSAAPSFSILFINAPYGFFIPSACARSESTSPILTPR